MPLIDFEHFGLRDRIAHLCHLWLEVPLKTVRDSAQRKGEIFILFFVLWIRWPHILFYFHKIKRSNQLVCLWFFSPLRTVRNSAKAEVDRELSGVVHGQPQSQPCSERCCLQQRSRDFRISASTDLCHLSADPNHPNWEINCNTWPFFFFFLFL